MLLNDFTINYRGVEHEPMRDVYCLIALCITK